jgi:hypothetical protein
MRLITLSDTVHVTGNLNVDGTLNVKGGTGVWHYVNMNDTNWTNAQPYIHLDPAMCPNGSVVKGVALVVPTAITNRIAVQVTCTD